MEKTEVKVVVADPTTLGLFGLAIVTLVASSQKLGITDGVSYLIPWAILVGYGYWLANQYGLFWRNTCSRY